MEQLELIRSEHMETMENTGISIPVVAFAAFLTLNAAKTALFNGFMLQEQTAGIFMYKFMMTLLTVIIIYPLLYRTGSRIAMVSCYALQALYMTVNLGYYLYFRSYLHIMQYFSLIREAFSVAGNSAVPLDARMLVALLDMPLFIFILMASKHPGRCKIRLGRNVRAAMLTSLLILASIESFNYIHKTSIIHLVRDTFSGESPIVERYGTLVNNLVDMAQNANNSDMSSRLMYGREISSADASGATGTKALKTAETVSSLYSASASGPNYILIQVESMDANIVNKTYKGSYVTPFLHSLESGSIYYPYVMSYHEGGGTSDSEFSVLNSVEPLGSYPALKLSGYDYPNSLAARLKNASYATLAFHGNVGSFYNRDVAFPKLGYGDFYDMLKMELPENGWGLPDDAVFGYALEKLGTVDEPFFAHIITMTSHEPFNSARNYYNNSLYDDIGDKTVREYFNSMSYVDKSIQDFVTKVKAGFSNTYVIIYGDHTPNIDSPMYSQASFSIDGKYFEFVPMMIITPDGRVRRETADAASFLDVAPTVLESSGINYEYSSDGADLLGSELRSGSLPFRGGSYDRALLFTNASATARP